jgi:hypothetical protein
MIKGQLAMNNLLPSFSPSRYLSLTLRLELGDSFLQIL